MNEMWIAELPAWTVPGIPLSLPQIVLLLAVIETAILFHEFLCIAWVIFSSATMGEGLWVCASRLCWEELQRLQSLSGLRCFAAVHPALIQKTWRHSHQWSNLASCVVLQHLFRQEENIVSQGELCDAGNQLIIRLSRARYQNRSFEKEAFDSMFDEPYGVASRLLQISPQFRNLPDLRYNPAALEVQHRLDFIRYCETGFFVLGCGVMFGVGVLCFVGKISVCAVLLVPPEKYATKVSPWYFWVSVMLFLNQAIGIVNIKQLMFQRGQVFVFAGHDAILSPEEKRINRVYLAKLMEAIWTNQEMPFWAKLALSFTFDDDDFQRLVVEENQLEKERVLARTRKYFQNHYGRWWDPHVRVATWMMTMCSGFGSKQDPYVVAAAE